MAARVGNPAWAPDTSVLSEAPTMAQRRAWCRSAPARQLGREDAVERVAGTGGVHGLDADGRQLVGLSVRVQQRAFPRPGSR